MDLSFHSFPGRVPGRNEEVRGQDLQDLKGELGVDGGWGRQGSYLSRYDPV
jgi:hypothetical protein